MRALILGGMALGLVAFLASLFLSPHKGWTSLLLGSYLILCLGLAGIFIVALFYAVNADWGVPLRRVPEAMASVLPYGAIGLAITFAAHPSLYPWVAGSVDGVAMTGFKRMWLNFPFFLIRAVIYIGTWIAFWRVIRRRSRRQDLDGSLKHTSSNVRTSIAFLVVFGFTFWLATTDWIMSLDPLWYSTIFAVYNFSGLFTSGLAMMLLLVLWLRKGPLAEFVRDAHVEDLGKVLFGFCTFWMYIWFCQYMLIWYANIPEETAYYVSRMSRFWLPLFVANVVLNWLAPFFLLLTNSSKRNPRILCAAAIIVLAGRFLDLFLMVTPALYGDKPVVGILEVSVVIGAVCLFLWTFIRAMQSASPVPLKDPSLIAYAGK
jgi:hypothetical protein